MTFAEGLASFVSPCTLPLLPVFVAYFAADGRHPLKRALAFVVGFSSVFILLGVASAGVGGFFGSHQAAVRIVSGVLLVLMALVFANVLPLRLPWSGRAGAPPASAFVFGLLFALNLTPCVGAFLAAALVAAANSESAAVGALLLAAYSLGLAVPFVLAALALARLNGLFARVKRSYRVLVPACALALAAYGCWMIHSGLRSLRGAPAAENVPSERSAPVPAPAGAPGEIADVASVAAFEAAVGKGVAIVDFWAPWCGPCRRMAGVLRDVAAEFPDVPVLKVDVDAFGELAGAYGITGIPAILRFDDGSVTARSVGVVTKDELVLRLKLRIPRKGSGM